MPLRMLINIKLTPRSSPAFRRVRKMWDRKSPHRGRNYPLSSRVSNAAAPGAASGKMIVTVGNFCPLEVISRRYRGGEDERAEVAVDPLSAAPAAGDGGSARLVASATPVAAKPKRPAGVSASGVQTRNASANICSGLPNRNNPGELGN